MSDVEVGPVFVCTTGYSGMECGNVAFYMDVMWKLLPVSDVILLCVRVLDPDVAILAVHQGVDLVAGEVLSLQVTEGLQQQVRLSRGQGAGEHQVWQRDVPVEMVVQIMVAVLVVLVTVIVQIIVTHDDW